MSAPRTEEPPPTPVEQGQDALAKMLALNHLHLTLPASVADKRRDICDDAENLLTEPNRIIVVVGAGASLAVGLPSTKEAIKEIEKLVPEKLLNQELQRLELESLLDRRQFETVLLAASRFDRHGVLDSLQRMFGHRYRPSLTYELLAHLLKHRFIDALINFNFDELLDQSIEDEVGNDNYLRVISDGDCPPDLEREIGPDRRFRVPVYVKPHGTVSHKSTMRFTRGDYYHLPTDIRRLLRALLSDKPVTLIVIGFNMQSFEFSQIVLDCTASNKASAIYNATLERRPTINVDSGIEQLYDNGAHLSINTTLDDRMRSLWQCLEQKFRERHRPRDISRHELVCKLRPVVAPGQPMPPWQEGAYLRGRAMVELGLAVAKAKGFVNTRVLLNGRAGKYFQLWKEHPHGHTSSPRTLFGMCRQLGLEQCSYSREALRLPSSDKQGSSQRPPPPRVVTETEFKEIVHGFAEKVGREMHGTLEIEKVELGSEMEAAFLRMFQLDEVEIVRGRSALRNELCEAPTSLESLTALKVCTKQALSASGWDTLLCIAETGEWLIKDSDVMAALQERKGSIRQILLLVADGTHKEAIASKFSAERIRNEIRELDWWLHNQHMTLYVEGNYVKRAFFFERRLRNSTIAPVMVEGEDAQALLEVFFAYWTKARNSNRIGVEKVENERRKYLSVPRKKSGVSRKPKANRRKKR